MLQSIDTIVHPSVSTQQSDSCRFELVCARCSTGCNAIPGGVFVEPQDTLPVCVDLSEGATAVSSGTSLATLTLEEGYYRTSAESQIVLECYQEDARLGGTAGDDSCASGYKGPCKCSGWRRCVVNLGVEPMSRVNSVTRIEVALVERRKIVVMRQP